MIWRIDCLRTLRDEKRPIVYSLDFLERAIYVLKHAKIQSRKTISKDQDSEPITRKPRPDHCSSQVGGPVVGDTYWKCEVDRLVDRYKDEIASLIGQVAEDASEKDSNSDDWNI
eukprot:gnl/MRDRNA2_/MRDRNA2_36289_c0_seq2.p1 gnl/MRDRNA2_/MRDRNA2_36289_c0~~gnl/MRDRNA2_/MRDRNA2_36289_c0_seq2.p1  ORF type:complete len:114 (-),score=12.77 gnl/MRDRNA2_/MRDRNA2_36289_c0_seq2:107-448(-)